MLVRIEACGLCHTDIHAARGDWPVKPTAPFVPGHEGVGRVEPSAPGVTAPAGRRPGRDRLAGHACGYCRYCVSGWETLCAAQQNSGYSVDGGYAEYAVADARSSCRCRTASPDGRRAADLRRRHHVQGDQGGDVQPTERVASSGSAASATWPCSTRAIVGGDRRRASTSPRRSSSWPSELGADHVVDAARRGPGRRDPGARRRRCRRSRWR